MRPLIAILGPTATGKTDLAMRLGEALDGEIINADALQVYRGLDIGTAKPSPELQAALPHHLIDVLDPEEPYSAGEFVRRARPLIDQIRQRDRTPILVGGSGLYLRALLEGLSPIPASDPETRQALERRRAKEGLAALYDELCAVDPGTARRLAPGDSQRILRALEVALSSGRPLSSWIRQRPLGSVPVDAVRIGLTLPRTILYDRISGRVRDMIGMGWVEEVVALLESGCDPGAPAFQAIGYRQIVRYIHGEWSLESAAEDTIRATRRYAKRQMTWFRRERNVRWISASDVEQEIPSLLEKLNRGGAVAR
ncbi:MAG: tRNA (adenosine(37)-N6)-dimethylallyltransferase MiaA [Acidobacteriota bacterium]